jgi:hypothetical protein
MTVPNKSIEPIFIDLAIATANALECPDCPERLKDALGDVASQLIEKLSPTIAFELRAVAGLAQSGDRRTRAEGETLVLGSQDAFLSGSESESDASLTLAASVN